MRAQERELSIRRHQRAIDQREAWRAETAAAARIDSPAALRAAVAELEAEQAAVQRQLERARARLRLILVCSAS